MTEQPGPPEGGRIKDIRVYRDSFIGMCMLSCTPFLIFASIPTYGWWAAIGMFLVWVLMVVQGTRWFLPKPRAVIGLGVGAFLLWLAVVLIASL